jgi:hypothetical protein
MHIVQKTVRQHIRPDEVLVVLMLAFVVFSAFRLLLSR